MAEPRYSRKKLLALFNTWWRTKETPSELFLARVVSIYKEGDADKCANYRPISLLSSFYKIYMIMIKERIQTRCRKNFAKLNTAFDQAAPHLMPSM